MKCYHRRMNIGKFWKVLQLVFRDIATFSYECVHNMLQVLFHTYPCSTAVNFYYYICHYFVIHMQTCILSLFRSFHNETHWFCLGWYIFQHIHTCQIFLPESFRRCLSKGDHPKADWVKWAGWSQFFSPLELSIFLVMLFQTNRTGHESSNWTGEGLEGSTPSFPLENSSMVVSLWLQDIRITATNRQVLKWYGSDCKVRSGPYRKESRLL